MSDPFAPPPGYGSSQGYGSPPGYAAPPTGYGPPPGYGPSPGYPAAYPVPGYGGGFGPPGEIRRTGKTFLLFIVTFGIYGVIYNYRVHTEMKRHTGTGIGGGIAVLLTFIAGIAMPFVTPAEVGKMYQLRRQPPRVKATTGLWVLLPAVGGFVVFLIVAVTLVSTAPTHVVIDANGYETLQPDLAAATIIVIVVGYLASLALTLVGQIVWFRRTNGALNDYWRAIGVPG